MENKSEAYTEGDAGVSSSFLPFLFESNQSYDFMFFFSYSSSAGF